jgi:hypothetical protein
MRAAADASSPSGPAPTRRPPMAARTHAPTHARARARQGAPPANRARGGTMRRAAAPRSRPQPLKMPCGNAVRLCAQAPRPNAARSPAATPRAALWPQAPSPAFLASLYLQTVATASATLRAGRTARAQGPRAPCLHEAPPPLTSPNASAPAPARPRATPRRRRAVRAGAPASALARGLYAGSSRPRALCAHEKPARGSGAARPRSPFAIPSPFD